MDDKQITMHDFESAVSESEAEPAWKPSEGEGVGTQLMRLLQTVDFHRALKSHIERALAAGIPEDFGAEARTITPTPIEGVVLGLALNIVGYFDAELGEIGHNLLGRMVEAQEHHLANLTDEEKDVMRRAKARVRAAERERLMELFGDDDDKPHTDD